MGTQAHTWLSMKTTMRCIRTQLGRLRQLRLCVYTALLKLIQVRAAARDTSYPHSHPLPWLRALLRAHFPLEISGIRSASRGLGPAGKAGLLFGQLRGPRKPCLKANILSLTATSSR